MKILLTGATGYIGKRLLPILIQNGHEVVCCVRDLNRFDVPESLTDKITTIQLDLLKKDTLQNIPEDIDAAYYLVHSMSASSDYQELELTSAIHFRTAIATTQCKQVVYLSGIVNNSSLSRHLSSRKNVESELEKGNYHLTTLRAGIIIGSGSASFEIIRDLVEKLPLMVAPKWLNTKCQPIAIKDVLFLLSETLGNEETYDKNFDIGGPDILTYKQMLLQFAANRNLRRKIITVPVMTPRLSSYWLYFVTSTSYKLAVALVNSMKIEVICRNKKLHEILKNTPISYNEALSRAFQKIASNEIISSWKDAYSSSGMNINISDFIQVPTYGCFVDQRSSNIDAKEACISRIWNIGGNNGWYYGDWLWRLRGFLDKLVGGVGLRRGRTHAHELHPGEALDFWRVLYADKKEGRLLLFAEMKLPGEAWLEFRLNSGKLIQTATFRPLGLSGRLYWYSVLPFHGAIFNGMLKKLSNGTT